jgi:hypothetical protein
MENTDTITYYYNVKILINGLYVKNGSDTTNVTNNDQYSGYSTFFWFIVNWRF